MIKKQNYFVYIWTIPMPILTLYRYAYFQIHVLCIPVYTKYNHTGLVEYEKNWENKIYIIWNDLPEFLTTINTYTLLTLRFYLTPTTRAFQRLVCTGLENIKSPLYCFNFLYFSYLQGNLSGNIAKNM